MPETLGALLAFLGFIVPGLAFELLRERRRPFIEETAFREASRIALTSALFSGVALLTLWGVETLLHPSWVAQPATWLRDGNSYLAENLADVAGSIVVAVGLALAYAVIIDSIARNAAGARIVPGSVWFSLFREHRPAQATPWLHIRLVDGTEVWGYVGDYTPDQKLENRELVIEGPELQYRRPSAKQNTMLPKWSFISVRGESISWMKVQYISNDSKDGDPSIMPAIYRQRRGLLAVLPSHSSE